MKENKMISLTSVTIILFSHFVADFLFQTNWMAKGKSNSMLKLSVHILTYTTVLTLLCSSIIFTDESKTLTDIFVFGIISGLLHFGVDFITSKITSVQYANGHLGSDSIPNFGFFSTIGFDQFLHSVMLLWIFYAI